MFSSLEGKSVIVTGGTKGIGKGIARVFASEKARVLVVGRDASAGEATAAELAGDVSFLAADVAIPADCERIAASARERHGGIDVLCANAGIFPQRSIKEMTAADVDEVMNTNVRGCILMVRACLDDLQASGRGRVILTSSITGPVTGYPGWSHYGASKAAQLGFMRTAAMELASSGITVNAVAPGNIATEGLDELGDGYAADMAATIPLRRLGSVEDIGYAALFLATEEAGYITGQTIIVDGGQILPESLAAHEG